MRAGLLMVLIAALAVRADGAELPTRKTKPFPLCGIPACYPYHPAREFSANVTEQSSPGILLETGVSAEALSATNPGGFRVAELPKSRYFQLPVYVLKKDHCSISRVSVILDELGNYSLSFRADQNPRLEEDRAEPRFRATTPPNPSIKQVSHLKRNEFHVEFRLLGAALHRETIAPSDVGRPVLSKIELRPFWVQSGEPLNYSHSGVLDLRGRRLEQVDRIEVDFSYR